MPRHVLEHLYSLAASDPEHVAIVHDGSKYSISTLLSEANRVASAIRETVGTKKEPIIAVSIGPGFERLVAMVGAWIAGGVYVPIDHDPTAPVERLKAIFDVAVPDLVLCDSRTRGIFNYFPGQITPQWMISELPEPTAAPSPIPKLSTLAYIVFTSGSTGKPKGVALEHKTLARLMDSVLPRLDCIPHTLQLAPGTFDMSLKETLITLAASGTLFVQDGVEPRDPELLLAGIRRTGANTVFVTPTALQGLRLLPEFHDFIVGHELHVICGGEQLTLEKDWGADLLTVDNHYGPTETHVVVGRKVASHETGSLPIGLPLHGNEIYLLDENMQPVDSGLIGEIWIGGDSLARGYLGRVGLTAERFLPDPFTTHRGRRMYRSGDLGRKGSNGEISLVGRIDDQVKIRGYRVEPAEVSAALYAHPAVRAVHAAGLKLDERFATTLIAWIQGDQTHDDNLRSFLARTLPPYMVPSHFIWVTTFPTSRNGKIETRRLPLPDSRRPSTGNSYTEPASALERDFASVWASELGLEKVGRDDNFFDLGGYSLQAVRLVFRLRNELGIEMPVHALYEAPTIAMLTNHSSVTAPSYIEPVKRKLSDTYTPSFGQKRMWLYQKSHPSSSTYNLPLVMRFRGPLDVDRFAVTLREMTQRIEILRTTMITDDYGEPKQNILSEVPIPLHEVQALGRNDSEKLQHVIRVSEAAASIPFDLSLAPLLRAYRMELNPEDHVLILVAHHTIMDGWSADLFAREASAIYAALGEDRLEPPVVANQYLDYAIWQKNRIGTGGPGLAYWQSRLAGAWQRPLILTAGHGAQDAFGHARKFRIDRSRANKLSKIATFHGTTDFVVMLTLYQRALQAWSSNDDIRIGVPVSGRTHAETARIIGYFSNTVVLRDQLRPGELFTCSLARAKETVNEAFQHQETPYDLVVEACNPPRTNGDSGGLFQASMSFAHGGHQAAEWNLDGMNPEFLTINHRGTQFPLTLFVEWDSSEEDMTLELLWNEHLVSDVSAAQLQSLLMSSVDDALEGGSLDHHEHENEPLTILDALESAATMWPERIFLEEPGKRSLRYREVLGKVNSIARSLHQKGVQRGDVVAVDLPRGAEQVVALLGVIRAGGIYLPTDPTQPLDRRNSMLLDSNAVAVIGLPGRTTPPEKTHLFEFDGLLRSKETEMPAAPLPTDQAYALFTSGSTGKPKAVLVSHAGPASLLSSQKILGLLPGSRILSYASSVFDASLWELLMALGTSGTLVFAENTTRLDPQQLDRFLLANQIDVALLTPTVLRTLVGQWLWRGLLISGGESLDGALASRMSDFIVDERLWNAYGPTETSIVSTLHKVMIDDLPAAPDDIQCQIQIGKLVDAALMHVMDDNWREVPRGESGELWLSGSLVGTGYLKEPAITANKFVPTADGKRCYRTGDRVRVRPDGSLDYLGRIDDQLKIFGQRIEPGEIESAMRSHPAIEDAGVHVQHSEHGEKLVARYVPRSSPVAPTEIRGYLKSLLPEAWIPSLILAVGKLPLLPSGKTDRKTLTNLEFDEIKYENTECPKTPSYSKELLSKDTKLIKIRRAWSKVLNNVNIRNTDNFFDMGGTSLDLVRATKAISSALGREISVRQLLAHQTPAELLHALERGPLDAGSRVIIHSAPAAQGRVIFVPPLNGELSCYGRLIACLEDPDRPQIQIEGVSLADGAAGTLIQFAERIAAALIDPVDQRPLCLVGWSIAAPLAYEIACALDRSQISAGVFVLDGHMPGAVEYELGAYNLARQLEELDVNAVQNSRELLKITGLADEELDVTSADWEQVTAYRAWWIRATGSHIATDSRIACDVVLAKDGKPAEEVDLMAARWRRFAPASNICIVETSHWRLLNEYAARLSDSIRQRIDSAVVSEVRESDVNMSTKEKNS